MIKDDFWRSNVTAGLSTEDRYTLVYLQTCPSSNVIGVFQIVPSISAAEMGWDPDQLLTVIRRLTQMSLVNFDPPTNFVWVRTWWQHNVINGAFAGKVRGKALAEIRAMPERWIKPYVTDLIGKASPDASVLQNDLAIEFLTEDAPSMGHPSPINGAVGTTTTVPASVNPTTTDVISLSLPRSLSEIDRSTAAEIVSNASTDPSTAQQILDELDAANASGRIRETWVQYLYGLLAKANAGGFHPAAGRTVAKQRAPQPSLREKLNLPRPEKIASREVAEAAIAANRRGLAHEETRHE